MFGNFAKQYPLISDWVNKDFSKFESLNLNDNEYLEVQKIISQNTDIQAGMGHLSDTEELNKWSRKLIFEGAFGYMQKNWDKNGIVERRNNNEKNYTDHSRYIN